MDQPRFQALSSLPPLFVGSWSLEERRPREAEKRDPGNEVDYGLADRKLSQSRDYRDVIVFENSVLEMFSVQTKTKSQRFPRAFWKRSVLLTD